LKRFTLQRFTLQRFASMISLAEILRRHWPAYEKKFGGRILTSHRRAVAALLRCRTAALGGQLYRCAQCGQDHYAYHSCNHRACPQCGHHDATAWLARQKTLLLPVPYFLLTFTLPGLLRAAVRSHQKLCYSLFFAQSAAALADIAADPKHWGVQLGLLGVLQTWTRQLRYHLHVHFLVPGGGLSHDQLRWLRVPNAQFFLPQQVLAARLRTRFKQALQQKDPKLFLSIPRQVWTQKWVVDVLPVGGGESALKYLSAYIYKTAITAQRLIACDEGTVTFRYRENTSGQWKLCRLSGEAFLQRFLQHILPAGFQRVRYFGWLAPAASKRRARILALLDWKAPPFVPPPPLPPPECPRCQKPMRLVGSLPRAPP
jgi:hypothetical protein